MCVNYKLNGQTCVVLDMSCVFRPDLRTHRNRNLCSFFFWQRECVPFGSSVTVFSLAFCFIFLMFLRCAISFRAFVPCMKLAICRVGLGFIVLAFTGE